MAYPTTKTNAQDNTTEIVAAHLNNLEDYVGITGSSDSASLTYKLGNTTGGHDHDGSDSKLLGNSYKFIPGMGMLWHGTIAAIPSLWAFSNGASLLRATYTELFTNIGTIHGAADGTHFNLPDLRDKVVFGAKQDDSGVPKTNVTGSLLQSGGSLGHTHTGGAHTHTVSQQAAAATDSQGAHTHTYSGTTSTYTADVPTGGSSGANKGGTHSHTFSGTTSSDGAHTHTVPAHDHGGATGSAGAVATDSTDVVPPFVVAVPIIFTGI